MKLPNVEATLQLHQELEIIGHAAGFTATLMNEEGYNPPIIAQAEGKTIEKALLALEGAVSRWKAL